ncbi:transposase, IS116/IS110/IS902 family [Enterococcus faecium DO]|nr:transposase, IS116/IS110/IS902 family [Enterococcus faecium DO]
MKLFVGIDVSSEKLDVCFLTDDNQLSILSEISVANDIEGASFIRETILEFNDSYHLIKCDGMESTSMYSFHSSMFFMKMRN